LRGICGGRSGFGGLSSLSQTSKISINLDGEEFLGVLEFCAVTLRLKMISKITYARSPII
jgi:hypothetical protein